MSSQKGPEDVPSYLKSLSAAQLAAATHPAKGALAISAPPGSGKTRVLTSRVAWLVLHEKIMPEEMVVVTFTNKAANEMKQRLHHLIGAERTARLVLGTFHSLCARYLRRYAGLIGMENNFSIMDADDSRKVIKEILKPLKEDLEAENLKIKPEQAQATISWSKAKGVSAKEYRANVNRPSNKGYRGAHEEVSSYKAAVATVYEEYEKALRKANALDFDDLLVMGADLLSKHPQVVREIRHVLVDEMQDTNTTQYQLMTSFASAAHNITTVGDPDQAVYGWRAAEVGNLDRMKSDFSCESAFLEENYRSTGSVLKAALAVIEQDKHRVAKGLFTAHPVGPPPVLKQCHSTHREAAWVATEIKRLVAHSGGLLGYDDFAILLRYNALSREVEQALQAENIPSRMVGGSKFFDRVEIKDVLAYLTLAVNPTYTPAFTRAINVPKRGIGEKSVQDFLSMATSMGLSPMQLAERVADESDSDTTKKRAKSGTTSLVKPSMKKGVRQFVGAIRELRKAAEKGEPVNRLIEIVTDNIDYKSHLEKEQDFESRMENVKELINFSIIVAASADTEGLAGGFEEALQRDQELSDSEEGAAIEVVSMQITSPVEESLRDTKKDLAKTRRGHRFRNETAIEIFDSEDDDRATRPKQETERAYGKRDVAAEAGPSKSKKRRHDRAESSAEPDLNTTLAEGLPLRTFLEACTLSTDLQSSNAGQEGKVEAKVTISTCHAAKGLEYPVVFVTGVEDGIFPFYRCVKENEVDEERRLLYVAMTRAQTLLYMTHCAERMVGGQTDSRSLSQFVRPVVDRTLGGTWTSGKKKAGSNEPASKVDFDQERPKIEGSHVADMAAVLERATPAADTIAEAIRAFGETATALKIAQPEPAAWTSQGFGGGFGLDDGYEGGYTSTRFGSGSFGMFGAGFGAGDPGVRRGYMTARSLSAGFKAPSTDVKPVADQGPYSTFKASTSARGASGPSHAHVSEGFTDPRLSLSRSAPARGKALRTPVAAGTSPLWIEDYKRTGNTALREPGAHAAAAEGLSREGLMSSFQSSSQASLDGLKGLLDAPGDSKFAPPQAGSGASASSASSTAAHPTSQSGASSSAPRPPSAGFAYRGGLGKRSKSLGMRRTVPSATKKTT
ncbi:unnamed protein product [Parajaminaea phylloscopi]